MKTTHDDTTSTRNFLQDATYSPLELRYDETSGRDRQSEIDSVVENIVPSVRWAFLYLPGAAAIHFIVMVFAMSLALSHWPSELLAGTFGTFVVALFMVMLGIGKLTDLRHLRSIGGIVAASLISAMMYYALLLVAPGDYFGVFSLATLPFALLAGYLLKEDTDRQT